MLQEFKAFLTKSNALALAVGVIIGAATGKVVSAVVEDVIMPVISLIVPSGDWRQAMIELKRATDASGKVTITGIKYGDLLGTIIDFVFIAFVVFMITKALLKPAPEPSKEPSKQCPLCLETIPEAAKKCRACASDVV